MDTHNLRLRTREAAKYLGLSSSTLEKKRLTGDGPPFYKCGRVVLYATRDLDEYLAARKRSSTSDSGSPVA
jgi:excisionase family DNA binding protein